MKIKAKCILPLLFLLLISKVTFAQILDEFYFANQLAASGPLGSRSDVVKVIQDETTGNFIVAGTYKGAVALDISNPLNATFSISVTSVQSFVAMYNSSGKYLWSASIYSSPTSANDSVLVSSIDVDDVGNIYVVGRVNVTSGDTIRVSSPYTIKKYLGIVNRAAFFTRINPYNPSDPDQYIDVIPASSSATVFINDCKFVKLGGVPTLILAGKFKGGVDLNLSYGSVANYNSIANTYSAYITAITTSGQANSSFVALTLNGTAIGNDVEITKISVASRESGAYVDTILYCGTFKGGIQLTSTSTLLSKGGMDIFFGKAKISINSSSNAPESVTRINIYNIGSPGDDYATDIAYSKDRNKIFLSGTYNGASLDLDVTGTGGPNNIGPSTDTDAFYVQYDKSFEHVGHAKFYGPSEQHIASMSLWNDTGDTILVGGGFKSQLSYGSSTLNAYGALDSYMLLIKTGATPTYLKSIHFGGLADDLLYTTCVSTSREAVAGGYFNGKVDFDASTSTYELTPTFPSGYIVAYGDNLLPYTNIYLSGSGDDEINTLTIDNNGEVFASGTYTSFAKIGSFNLTSAGGTDVFIQRKHKTGADAWAINAARLPNGAAVFNPQEISNKLSSAGNDKSRSIASGDTSVYLAYIKNDTAYVQRINRNTGGPIWSQKINKNGSDIAGIVVDDQYLYFVGDSAGVHITQRVNKNTGGPIWSQRVPNGKSKAITQDHSDLYTVKDSSGYAVVSRVNKNTGGPIWSQRIAGHSGSSIAVMGDDIFMMSDSSGNIVLRKINKNTGGPIWSQRVGTGTLGRVTVNYTKGAVYISGTFTGTSSYLGLTSGGGTDGFVARVNKNTGGPVWSQRVGGPGADSIKVLEVTLGSDVYIAGNTQGGTFGNTSAGPGIFLVRLSLDSLDKSTFIEPIKTNFDEFDCQIYPNPTRDIFNISATLSAPEYVQIRLLDLKGRIVFQEMQGKQSIIQSSVDIGELPNGLYILQIQAGKQQVTRKVVKY